MNSKIAGYQGKLEISIDGLKNFYRISGITKAELNEQCETENISTWDDDGWKNEEPINLGIKVSLDGFIEDGDPGQQMIESRFFSSKKFAYFRYYNDKRNINRFYEFSAYISSFKKSQEVQGKLGFSVQLSIRGQIRTNEIFNNI